ncbi:MAG: isopeptide-forming domain-containing fimbrial protein [Ruminococcus sp.]|nr:isopeptide-forming domain-containing fimbrial protein [Ruminococcus sp.]
MKNTKKLTAMMLSGAMALSLSLSLVSPLAAFADDPPSPSITINADEAGHTFTGYQILKGTLTDGQLFNTAWGADILATGATSPTDLLAALKADTAFGSGASNLFYNVTTAPQFADVISKFTADSDKAVELAKVIADTVKGSGKAISYDSETSKYSSGDIDTGYYLVVDATANTGTAKVVKSRYLLEVADTVEVNAKVVKPTLDKNIVVGTGTDATKVKANTAGMDDTVNFELSSAVPDMTGYSQYYYIIEDTLSPGFVFNDDVVITIGTDTLTELPTSTTSTDPPTGDYSVYTKTVNGATKITIVFRDFYDKWNDDTNDAITVEYSAKVDTDADCTTAGNPNTAQLIYSNDPNYKGRGDGKDDGEGSENDADDPDDPGSDDTGKGGGTGGPGSGDDKDIPGEYGGSETKDGENGYVSETAQVETKTYLTSVKINKVDESNIALSGAEFSIKGTKENKTLVTGIEFVAATDGTYYKLKNNKGYTTTAPTDATAADYESTTQKYKKQALNEAETYSSTVEAKGYVDDNGVLTFAGLGDGTYTITEVTAPEGYNLLNSAITVVVKGTIGTDNSVTWSVGEGSSDLVKLSTDQNGYELTVVNKKGTLLPTTGGIGTTIFYVVGGLLVSASAIFIITKKRTSNAVE